MATIALACATTGARAASLSPSALTALSGPDLACRGAGSQAAGEAEPSLAVHPGDPRRLLAAWQQNRYPDGGAVAIGVSLSTDGGASWRRVTVPGVTSCPAPAGGRTSDPWVSIGPDGVAYLASLPLRAGTDGAALTVARSGNGGVTWSAPVTVSNAGFSDKESVTADPFRPGVAYVAWTHVEEAAGKFSRSGDGGRTWSTPVTAYRSPVGTNATGHVLAVLADGTLVDAFSETTLGAGDGLAIMSIRSRDGGATWSAPLMLGTASGRSVLDPDGGTLIRTGEGLPSIAASPDGSVRVVWTDVAGGRSTRILVAKSSDGGRSWSAPATAVRRSVTAFTPVVAAAPSGALAITFYDFRYDRRGDKPLTTDAWIAHSDDGGGRWSTSRLAGPFDLRTAAQTSGGPFLGDYTGLVGVPGGFVSALVQGSPLAPAAGGDVFGIVTRAGTRRPAIRLSVRPGSARRGPRVRLSFLARAKEGRLLRPLLGARVRFGGHTVTTDVRGRASIRIRLRAARYTGHATRPGFRPASATLRTHR